LAFGSEALLFMDRVKAARQLVAIPSRAWSAAHGIRDHAIGQGQPIVGPGLVAALGETGLQESLEQQYAGMVAGKGASRPVRTGPSGGEAQDQKARPGVAK
jgi:hypothetical protein